jgi:hypothetical protein
MRAHAIHLLAGVFALSSAGLAHAQPDRAADSDRHFRRGLELYEENNDAGALAEFRAAWDAAPHPQIAYNLGRVHDRLSHAVEAVDWYERFVATAGERVPRRQRDQVARDLERLRARIGRVRVESNVAGAWVTVAGADVVQTPVVDPMRFDPGVVELGMHAPGYETQRRRVEIAGGTEQTIRFELRRVEEPRGSVRVLSSLEAVRVRVDDGFVGETPLPTPLSLAPGRHVIRGDRDGYLPERQEVDVVEGVETRLRLSFDRDEDAPDEVLGRINLRLPRAPTVVRVDGDAVVPQSGMLEVPAGPHRLRIEVAEREPVSTRVQVPAGGSVDVAPDLEWAADARAERLAGSSVRRAWGLGTLVTGAALAIASGAVFLWSQARYGSDEADMRRAEITRCITTMPRPFCPDLERWQGEEQRLADETNTFLYLSMAGGVVGLISVVAGGWLYLGAPSDDEIDDEAGASVGLGLGGIALDGRF